MSDVISLKFICDFYLSFEFLKKSTLLLVTSTVKIHVTLPSFGSISRVKNKFGKHCRFGEFAGLGNKVSTNIFVYQIIMVSINGR